MMLLRGNLVCLFRVFSVGGLVEELLVLSLARRAHFDLDEPALVQGGIVDRAGGVLQGLNIQSTVCGDR